MVEKPKKKTVLLMADDDEDDCLLMNEAVREIFKSEHFSVCPMAKSLWIISSVEVSTQTLRNFRHPISSFST